MVYINSKKNMNICVITHVDLKRDDHEQIGTAIYFTPSISGCVLSQTLIALLSCDPLEVHSIFQADERNESVRKRKKRKHMINQCTKNHTHNQGKGTRQSPLSNT